ncbi:MAG: FtsH protease activity modulator HflK, partial [Acidobacteriota bacterium]|nr:FtsH protease activity modulator HflK [Acidobacteriota bacterium]
MDDRGNIRSIPLRQFQPPKIEGRAVGIGLVALLAVLLASTSWYTVDTEEVGVVLRFGKYVRETEPGFHLKLPLFIERVQKVAVRQQLKEEFGFRTESAAIQTVYSERDRIDESLMLTGDLNVAVVEWITQYRIADPYKYLFKVRSPRDTFRDMNEAVMREVVGDRSVNEVLTIGRQEIEIEVETLLQELCDQYDIGLQVEQVVLQDVNPPDPVKPSFNEVNQAQQERERMINEAQAEFNRIIPRARGEAQQTIQQAQGYAADRVNRASGDAALFNEVLEAYQTAPEVTRRRIYLET